ncbi:hypothetical protein [Zobellia uliginosa]|nr:hypothetical protein [Zobellia uliginosa]
METAPPTMPINGLRATPMIGGAAVASGAIVTKLGLQDKIVHFSYNNFIDAPAGPDAENELKISCDGLVERWNFDPKVFF